jgi:hypothetical protein
MSLSRLPNTPAPDPSLQAPSLTQTAPRLDMSVAFANTGRPNPGNQPRNNAYGPPSTLPNANSSTKANEISSYVPSMPKIPTAMDHPGYGAKPSVPVQPKYIPPPDTKVPPSEDTSSKSTPPRNTRPGPNPANRLTVANVPDEPDIPAVKTPQKNIVAPSTASSARSLWPTAEEEKKRLYDKARADVERVQGSIPRGSATSQVRLFGNVSVYVLNSRLDFPDQFAAANCVGGLSGRSETRPQRNAKHTLAHRRRREAEIIPRGSSCCQEDSSGSFTIHFAWQEQLRCQSFRFRIDQQTCQSCRRDPRGLQSACAVCKHIIIDRRRRL